MKQIILASNSPRRSQLLKQIGIKFKVDGSNFDEESIEFKTPTEMVRKLSQEKAKVVFNRHKNSIIIAADTTVVLNKVILGKPKSLSDARNMLLLLSGKAHKVITGLTVMDSTKIITKHAITKIKFKEISKQEIEAYVKAENVLDKAGSYAIQDKGGLFIERIGGDYSSVLGIPLTKLVESLKEFKINVISNW